MELRILIDALSDPSAYPIGVETIEVRQTHISVVFLVGNYVYKIKKPVELGFLDFSTLEKRRYYCEEEVRLNRRLAPDVYLGVVPVVRRGTVVQVEGSGEIIEWAVKMERLPDEATLCNRLLCGDVSVAVAEGLANKIAAFHAQAEAGARISAFGKFDVVARNARENFEQSVPQVGTTLSRAVFDRFRKLTDDVLEQYRLAIERRAARGIPRDTHGDLRLEHVYLFEERKPPANFVVIDCIEFNERYRYADPVADMAFLTMEFKFYGQDDLARAFTDAYFRAAGDEEGRVLVPFYTSYRAAVRGKVEGIKLAEAELPEADRATALAKARRLWLLGLSELEKPSRRPCLVLIGGLPGTGKSTLAADLAQRAGLYVIRSDLVRKELAGLDRTGSEPQPFGEGIYTPDWTEQTYAECLRRAEARLFEGQRVIVDASFREESKRRLFLEAATRWGVPGACLLCQAEASVIRERLARRRNDASDADWTIYLKAAESWEAPTAATRPTPRIIRADGPPEQTLEQAIEALWDANLL